MFRLVLHVTAFMTQVVHPLPGRLKKNWGHKLRVYPLLQAPLHHCELALQCMLKALG